jgi:predicted HD phosphohydrolase
MLNHHKSIFVILLMFSVIALPSLVLAEQTDAAGAIASAKAEIVTCYQAAREAEGAGANISSLTATLNDAGALLSQAEAAYSQNDFDAARNLAVQSQDLLSNLFSEAN